jgi:hypothetical protein
VQIRQAEPATAATLMASMPALLLLAWVHLAGTKHTLAAFQANQLEGQPFSGVGAATEMVQVKAFSSLLRLRLRPVGWHSPQSSGRDAWSPEQTVEVLPNDTLLEQKQGSDHSRHLLLPFSSANEQDVCCVNSSDPRNFRLEKGKSCQQGFLKFDWPVWHHGERCSAPPLDATRICCVMRVGNQDLETWEGSKEECDLCQRRRLDKDRTFVAKNWNEKPECKGIAPPCSAGRSPFGAYLLQHCTLCA